MGETLIPVNMRDNSQLMLLHFHSTSPPPMKSLIKFLLNQEGLSKKLYADWYMRKRINYPCSQSDQHDTLVGSMLDKMHGGICSHDMNSISTVSSSVHCQRSLCSSHQVDLYSFDLPPVYDYSPLTMDAIGLRCGDLLLYMKIT